MIYSNVLNVQVLQIKHNVHYVKAKVKLAAMTILSNLFNISLILKLGSDNLIVYRIYNILN